MEDTFHGTAEYMVVVVVVRRCDACDCNLAGLCHAGVCVCPCLSTQRVGVYLPNLITGAGFQIVQELASVCAKELFATGKEADDAGRLSLKRYLFTIATPNMIIAITWCVLSSVANLSTREICTSN